MPFLNNSKFKEIRQAASNGDEKALMVLQALRQGSQEDLDRLVGNYYNIPNEEPVPEPIEEPVEDSNVMPTPQVDIEEQNSIPEIEDLTGILDTETDGLFDENEIEPMNFSNYLSNKRRDLNRARKNSDYFKAFNPEGRENYIVKKKNDYKLKFGDSIHDIDRQFKDYNTSIDKYSQGVNDMLDDDVEMSVDTMGKAYDDITENNGIMHSFGRYWDDDDTNHIIEDLSVLVKKYGKKNVISALNILKTDNENYRDYRLGQINEEVERYNKSLDKILK